MSSQNTRGRGGVGQRIEEAVELIEMELRHAIAYLNDAVIPQVRRESIDAMRMTADTLRDLADKFERAGAKGPQTGNKPPVNANRESQPKEPNR
jgi:hypothetical protein